MAPPASLLVECVKPSRFLETQSDERLVELVREGSDPAFGVIVDRYEAPLQRHCRRLLGPQRAEDAVQQCFLNAYQALRHSETEVNLRPWLYRIAWNAALDVRRAQAPDPLELTEQIDGVERPDEALERREEMRSVLTAIQALPERQRDALVLREFRGESYDEIATELGATCNGVRQLLARARHTLSTGARAVMPAWLLPRFATSGGAGATSPAGEAVVGRLGEAVAGTLLVKAGMAVVMTGAVVGGAAVVPYGDRAEPPAVSEPSEPRGGPAGTPARSALVHSPPRSLRASPSSPHRTPPATPESPVTGPNDGGRVAPPVGDGPLSRSPAPPSLAYPREAAGDHPQIHGNPQIQDPRPQIQPTGRGEQEEAITGTDGAPPPACSSPPGPAAGEGRPAPGCSAPVADDPAPSAGTNGVPASEQPARSTDESVVVEPGGGYDGVPAESGG